MISVNVTTPSGTITSVTLNYAYNGVAQSPISMTNVSGNTWTGTIPAPTSPTNATVTWTVTATNSVPLNAVYVGTSYSDVVLANVSVTASATPSTVCAGSPVVLNIALGGSDAPLVLTNKFSDSFESGVANFTVNGTATVTQNSTYSSLGANSMLFNTATISTDVSASYNTNIDLSTAASATLTFTNRSPGRLFWRR